MIKTLLTGYIYQHRGYFRICRAAIVRAAGCIQLEAEAEGKDIQVFSLHPGKAINLIAR